MQGVCDHYNCPVESFHSLVDGKAIWCLLDYYFQKELHNICSLKVLNFFRFLLSADNNFLLISFIFHSFTGSLWNKWQGIDYVSEWIFRCTVQFYIIPEVDHVTGEFSGGKYPNLCKYIHTCTYDGMELLTRHVHVSNIESIDRNTHLASSRVWAM